MGLRLIVRLIIRTSGALVALRLLLAAAAGTAVAAAVWATKLLVDGLAGAPGPPMGTLALVVAVTGGAAAFLPHLGQFVDAETSRRLTRQMQNELFTNVNRMQSLASLEDRALRDRLHVAQTAALGVPFQVLSSVQTMVQTLLMIGGVVAVLFAVSPLVTAVVLASAVPNLVGQLLISRRQVEMVGRTAPRWRRQLFFVLMLLDMRAAKEIRLFGTGPYLQSRMDQELAAAHADERRLDRFTVLVGAGLALMTAVIAGWALLLGVARINAGEADVGSLAVLVAALVGVQGVLSSATGQTASVHGALKIFDAYARVVTGPADLPERAHATPVTALRRGIELRDVWFRYHPDLPWVLRGVSLTIPAGSATAIVGLNGAGKSTVVKLLCRLYDPDRGTITWDGTDLRDLPIHQLRRRIRAVFQDFMTYEMTGRENIALGDLARMDAVDEIRAAARRAQIDEVLDALPDGYDTVLSRSFTDADAADESSGVLLSGGQWQRLALARAMLHDGADLLILDEPSTGLDPQAEHELQRRLRELRAGRTSLLISHRLNTIREADRIIVLTGDGVVEEGDHDTLIAKEGEYSRLFAMQAAGYQLSAASGAGA